jgi:hypothetical protein
MNIAFIDGFLFVKANSKLISVFKPSVKTYLKYFFSLLLEQKLKKNHLYLLQFLIPAFIHKCLRYIFLVKAT